MCERDQMAFWTRLLNLDGFEVVHEEPGTPDEPRRFTVIPKVAVGLCPHCGRPCEEIHRRTESDRVHDLPIGERAVELKVRIYQYWCVACERAFTPPIRFLAPEGKTGRRKQKGKQKGDAALILALKPAFPSPPSSVARVAAA